MTGILALCTLLFLPPAVTQAKAPVPAATPCTDSWPLWDAFKDHFVDDGRVIDHTDGARTVSEGQAYGLFFALVANDRKTFNEILAWTEKNLARGDLESSLPSWLWGKSKKGTWKVLDENPASDADMWIAYTLIEAGRVWDEPAFTSLGRSVLGNVAHLEVTRLPGKGPIVLPGPKGFVLEKDKRWRLNPSYLPLQLVERFAKEAPDGPWEQMQEVTVSLVAESAPHGFAPDWVEFHAGQGFVPDPVKGPVGSYDAIRTYLWAEMLPVDSAHRERLSTAVSGMYLAWAEQGRVPEIVNTQNPESRSGSAPVGYFAAILPQALRWGGNETAKRLERQIDAFRTGDLYGNPPRYYDHVLLLFGTGFREGRYHFGPNGYLKLRWEKKCSGDE